MQSTFHLYEINGPIEMDVMVARLVDNILKILKHPQSYHVDEK